MDKYHSQDIGYFGRKGRRFKAERNMQVIAISSNFKNWAICVCLTFFVGFKKKKTKEN